MSRIYQAAMGAITYLTVCQDRLNEEMDADLLAHDILPKYVKNRHDAIRRELQIIRRTIFDLKGLLNEKGNAAAGE